MAGLMRLSFALVALLGLVACEESLRPERSAGLRFADQNQWSASINQYRSQLARNPDDAEALQGYYAAVEGAEEFFILRARRLANQNDLSGAEGMISQGLVIIPESNLLREELEIIREKKAARGIYRDAELAARMGRHKRAMELVEQSLAKDADYRPAISLLETLFAVRGAEATVKPIRLQTGAPVSLNFSNADFKEAALALGRAYGVNMIFDPDLPTRAISIYADNVDFPQAFQLLLKSNGAFYRRLGENTVIIARDTPDKRAEYEDYVVRTFFVQSGNAQTIADTLMLTLGLRTVSVNEADNSITVRDTAPRILLADRLINSNDSEPAEVLLEVEVLEVNRTKSERLGLDFGSEITIRPETLPGSDVFPLDDAYATAAVTLPAATFRYFKQDVDARTLASPRIRAIDGREAVFHVGDQVPLRATEIIDSDGQVRNTFEYRDIGIKLNAVPEVRLDSSVMVNLRLEVSTLGQNLGTTEDPAFSIGTRRVETRMTLEDGETAIIGGLIRDEERDTVQKVPGLGNIPGVGKLFRSRDGSGTRTDILLTLTPRMIRGRSMPSLAESQFFSGTGTQVTTEAPLDFLAGPTRGNAPTIRLDLSGQAAPASQRIPAPTEGGPAPLPSDAEPVLGFQRNQYQSGVGESFTVAITAADFPANAQGTAIIRFRPDIVLADQVASNLNLPSRIDNERGLVELQITPQVAGQSTREIATITFTAQQAGLSYLIFGNAVGAQGARGLPDNVELQNSRIVVR